MKKICRCCREEKHISEYPKNMTYKDGHMSKCKVCWNVYQSTRMKKIRGTDVKKRSMDQFWNKKVHPITGFVFNKFNN